ncbi:hypothetical protein U9M48_037705 [Paspalum notatum var. saurae]|uniref:Protein kinase domain-containing protein n=1 Tax=Paspalum notatum var. saurae TaxID=547442 RepID=A0AAQ3UJX3_PASNO
MNQPENALRGYIQDNGKPMWTTHNNHNIRHFTEEEIKIITRNYNTPIGKGAFGEVYKGVLDDHNSVAVKRYMHNVKESFAKEVIVHCQINHRNVVRLIGYCIGENTLMMVTEYISKGNLSDILHHSEMSISLETRLGIAINCAEALSYMHYQMYGQVIHGDIKPANILLDANLNAKISDFGISKLLSTDNTLYTTHVLGSIGYMDPLFAQSGRLTSKSDVYSFGVVLLELITRRKAVDDGKISLIENFTQAIAKRKKIREFYDVKVVDYNNMWVLDEIGKLAVKCLAMDIEKRPKMKDAEKCLRMLRKSQLQTQEKKTLFSWIWRGKQPRQNIIPIEVVERNILTPVKGKHLLGSFGSVDLEDLLTPSVELLGKSKYGTTYKTCLEKGLVLTVKRLKSGDVPEAVVKERISIIGAIEHELIVPLLYYYISKDEKLLVYDYFPNGSLSSNLHGKNKAPVDWETRSAITLSAARAVAYIHSTNAAACHGNLHSSNILLTENHEARVSEYGLKTLVSTPTSVIKNKIAQKGDVYRFGVLLLEIITGKSPVHMATSEEPDLLDWVLSIPLEQWATEAFDKKILAKNSVVNEMAQFLKLAIRCCDMNPPFRPSMSEVVQQIEEIRGSTSTAGDRQFTGRSNVEGEEQTFSQGT